SIEARLAELKELRRTDPARYWGAEVQAEELALISGQVDAAEPEIEGDAESDGDADAEQTDESDGKAEAKADLAAIVAERKEIEDARKSNPKSYDDAAQAREAELLDLKERYEVGAQDLNDSLVRLWRREGGLKANMQKALAVAERAGDTYVE